MTASPDSGQYAEWTDLIAFVPSDMDQAEGIDFFDSHPIDAFEAWVQDLDDTSFCEISRALTTLRSAIVRSHAEKNEYDDFVTTEGILSTV